jgi:hypothetical protein
MTRTAQDIYCPTLADRIADELDAAPVLSPATIALRAAQSAQRAAAAAARTAAARPVPGITLEDLEALEATVARLTC